MKICLLIAFGVGMLGFVFLCIMLGLYGLYEMFIIAKENKMKTENELSVDELKEMYETNENGFKDYVDKWCECRKQKVEDVLKFKEVNYKAQDCKGILIYENDKI